ncbi:MAG: NAD(P)-dependent oxidoreductase [Clostridia bacterium]|nr:NAD(P)-dependent oxidoreductase [Clostridia bacterium]
MYSEFLKEDLKNLSDYLDKTGFAGSRIMVTGATGLIGSLVIKAICEYNKTHKNAISCVGFARNPQKVKSVFADFFDGSDENISFVYQDIAAPVPEGTECDYIIHTANSTTSKYFITNPVEVIESIYTGTKQIFDYAKESKVKGLVYLSSMEAFGQVYKDGRIGESELGYIDIQNIRSCYSEGKRLAECMAAAYAKEYGLPVRVARLSQTFGAGVPEGENRVFAQFARSALKGEDIVLHTKGGTVGNYCYTADVVRALLLLLKNGADGDVYTVVNEETAITIADMAKMVAKEFSGGRSEVVFDIPEGNTFGYAPETKMRLSSKKLNSLGWSAKYNLKEMYERMLPDLVRG